MIGPAASAIFLLAAFALSVPSDPPPTIGTFADRKVHFEIQGAYSFWDKSSGPDDDPVIRVAVSNDRFKEAALDEYYDRGHAINVYFADSKVVYFEFDGKGRYQGLSYYFGPGVGCGYCYDSKVGSTVKISGGRLQGELSYKGDDIQFQIRLDVRAPSETWGDPLPSDGGDPGRVYLAYHAALEKRDAKAIVALLDADMKERWRNYEQDGQIDVYLDFRWDEMHGKMKTIAITGGFVRGDRAVVLFDGSNPLIEKLHGEALLRREGAAWLVHADMVDFGAR